MLSLSGEDYLKAIYELAHEADQPWAGTSALAHALGIAPASVTEMLKRMAAAEPPLVEYQPYSGARLTADGERAALRIVRTHRLVEQFLVETLGFTWDEVHDEAHRLEHAVSDRVVERMAVYLGHPVHDPHGDPIPGPGGELAPRHDVALTELGEGETARVTRVPSHDPALLRHLGDLGIYPEVSLRVAAVAPFDGPMTLEIGDQQMVIGRAVAERVSVEPIAAGGEINAERGAP
jgi:DtxR family transcriptional regulator, Mn-dependent transcriptional regulator